MPKQTSPTYADAVEANEPHEPFAGWLWGIWLIFLVFPMGAVWSSPISDPAKYLGLAIVVAFGVTYVLVASRLLSQPPSARSEWGFLALCLFPVLLVPIAGVGAIGLLPFLSSYGAFGLRRPFNWLALTAVVIVGILWVLSTGEFAPWAWFVFILIAVSGGTAIGRFSSDQGRAIQETRQRLAIIEERERVARDVHDVLGHSLTVVTIKAELAEKLMEADPQRAKAELVEIQKLSRQALAEIRATVGGLRATRISAELEAAERALADAGIAAELPDDGSVVDPTNRIVVAWALREAVTNVVRHSHAKRCQIELRDNGIVVTDDGRGLQGKSFGNGLAGLSERVASAGGELRVSPGADGRGTRVEVTWA